MHKTTIIITGGTIGSEVQGQSVGLEDSAGRLSALFGEIAAERNLHLTFRTPLQKLSEDFQPTDWATVLHDIKTALSEGAHSIVVTHGTDTLHFTAPYVAQFLSDCEARICFTGAFSSPDQARSDATVNITAALTAATSDKLPHGVYCVFGEGKGVNDAMVIRAGDLCPMRYDMDTFRPFFHRPFPNYTEDGGWSPQPAVAPFDIGINPPSAEELEAASARIGYGLVYPGQPAGPWRHMPENSAVVLESFHAGTANAGDCAGSLIALRRERADMMICLASVPTRYVPTPYETSRKLADHGISVLENVPPHIVYIACLTRAAAGVKAPHLLDPFREYLI